MFVCPHSRQLFLRNFLKRSDHNRINFYFEKIGEQQVQFCKDFLA